MYYWERGRFTAYDPVTTSNQWKEMAALEKRGHFHLSKVGKQCNQNDDWNRYTKEQ
jgi:hypothetical protein